MKFFPKSSFTPQIKWCEYILSVLFTDCINILVYVTVMYSFGVIFDCRIQFELYNTAGSLTQII